jgi:hypothetical protein
LNSWPLTLDEWLGVLELGQKYLVDVAVMQAREKLTSAEALKELSIAAQLRIVWEFRLEDLYETLVEAILAIRPFPCFDARALMDLEPVLMAEINKIYHQARQVRDRLVAFVPELRHDDTFCIGSSTRDKCGLNWREVYCTYTRLLCHTTRGYSARSLLGKISREPVAGMDPFCKEHMVQYMNDGFAKEDEVFAEGKATLLQLLKSTRPLLPHRSFCT